MKKKGGIKMKIIKEFLLSIFIYPFITIKFIIRVLVNQLPKRNFIEIYNTIKIGIHTSYISYSVLRNMNKKIINLDLNLKKS